MSRREEVDQIITVHKRFVEAENMENPARCVDELSVQLDRLARTLADEVDERDAIIEKLLKRIDAVCSRSLYERACEIAGRKE